MKLNANDNALSRFAERKSTNQRPSINGTIFYTTYNINYTREQSVPDVVVSCPANIKISTSSKIPGRSISLPRLENWMIL